MKSLYLLALCLLIPTGSVLAHPREDGLRSAAQHNVRKPARLAMAMTDAEPRVRIRGNDGSGLTQRGFAVWINRHPGAGNTKRADISMWMLASSAPSIRINAFAVADHDRNGRVSATELADFVSAPYLPLKL